MAFEVSLEEAKQMVTDCFYAKLVPMLTGSPGIGKSAIMHAIAEELNLKVIDIRLAQCDPTDMLGFPSEDEETGKAFYRPMDTFPLEGDPIPEGYSGWLIFLDEMNSADRDVQKACYKTVYDKKVGNTPLHKNCVIAGAGNLDTDNAIVEEMSTALQSRMVHIEASMKRDYKNNEPNGGWLEWATDNGINHRVTSYIRHAPNQLFNFNPDHDDKTFACPRTWEFASRIIKDKGKLERTDRALLAGILGEGVGRQFASFCDIDVDMASMKDIVADPTGIPVPDEPSVQFMMSGMIGAHLNEDNINPAMEYINRLPKEFQVITIRDARRRDPELKQHKAMKQWITENATELF